MKQLFSLIVLLGFLISAKESSSQIDFDFNGYVYDIPSYQGISDAMEYFGIETDADHAIMNLTRLRLRPTLHLSEDSRITIHYELDMTLTDLSLPYFQGSGMTNRQAVDLHWTITDKEHFTAQHYIDMLYYKHIFEFGEFIVGRQVLSWGTGRIWQPTDLFNPINPANYNKFEKDGADAASFKYYLGDFTDLEVVYNFRERLKDGNFAARFRSNINEYDISLMTGYFDNKGVVGADFAGNLFDAGFRGEAVYSFHNEDTDSNYIRFILGLDYQLTGDLYALIEYQYNGEGTTDKSEYINYMGRVLKGEIQNVSRNYLAVSANYQLHSLISTSLTSVSNLNDGSGFAGLTAKWETTQTLNLGLGSMFFFGPVGSEYWYYSSAFYITAEFFF